MQSVQGSDAIPAPSSLPSSKSVFIKWGLLGSVGLINGYATILMYSRGELAFALLTVILTALALYIFGSKKTYAHRYIYPGIAGMILFILFPLAYTVGLAFTNYSAKNQLSLERTQTVLLDRSFQSGESYPFTLYKTDNGHQIVVKDGDQLLATDVFSLEGMTATEMDLSAIESVQGEKEKIKAIIQNRSAISGVDFHLPDGDDIRMSGLRKFAAVAPLYTLQGDGETLINNESGEVLKPNMEVGFYQPVDEKGEFIGNTISPGFVVDIGTANFERVWKDDGIKEPFISIFIWTVVFSICTVVFTLAIGLILANIVQWEELKGRSIYRVLLILPYAVPAFISILIFKGLFNQSFGEINMVLESIFGLSPNWFSDPILAKTMVLIVNTWLGFPYMMILCMGLLKAIPEDLYEASAIDGANFLDNFKRITFPLMIKPLTPLLIAAFAFNFNNFVMIQLLTNGGPNMIGTSEPAGYTDLLVSYTYRIAFEGGGGQDFGLASAIATLIFLLVGALALLNLRFTKLTQD
ncbi:maltose ABC transporter permease MalF [Vibrio splendidus]|jgi:maltose/maltodextrin transport system permease protein|uniref:Maltose/maltodextrin transport system permease protein n=1 Tax=Vibrio splendidus TaxID=29497 RepID=A0A2N7ML01_VIBSP|nr:MULTISPECIES: maltose ABC transporter permease MalF [Vibrio]HAS27507.1 maltose ABC transporter permease MalF [Vibrio sp.]EAP96809.1 ABC-type sugar transport system, permease component [Vibrio splendidus 12B01]MCF7485273.1 maltose ABC transporter permease MalF [Vibrio sp. A2-1]MDH5929980.1 maltose ABC transporter permease MalF [Vibrio splendidus]NOI91022.1 maltose ABC transporter permease MalF [Vibrio splendidus]